MKIRSLRFHIVLLTLSISVSTIIAQKNEPQQPEQTIEEFLDVNSQTPSLFGVATLRSFFQRNYDFLASRKRTGAKQDKESKSVFFHNSLSRYIVEEYNTQNYAERLSRDGTHFIEFLRIGLELNLDVESIYTCQRLLFNKVKDCEVIDDTVVNQILTPLAELIEPYFIAQSRQEWDLNYIIKEVDALILRRFTNHLPVFQASPDTFITELATEIVHATHDRVFFSKSKDIHQTDMVDRLRSLVKQTVEILLSKMMWNPHSFQSIKPSFISIGNSILQLAEKKIINHMDDLDDLLISLNSRFCFFFKMYGSIIPAPAIDELVDSLKNQEIFFLEIDEQDSGITPKKDLLMQQLLNAKVKAIALSKGIQTDQLV